MRFPDPITRFSAIAPIAFHGLNIAGTVAGRWPITGLFPRKPSEKDPTRAISPPSGQLRPNQSSNHAKNHFPDEALSTTLPLSYGCTFSKDR